MTSRERVLRALNHEEPDRVPLDLGGGFTSVLLDTYRNLRAYLGITEGEVQLVSRVWQLARVEEAVLRHFEIDTRYVVEKGPKRVAEHQSSSGTLIDEWGVERRKVGYYYDIVRSPLEAAETEDLARYPWPDPLDPGCTDGIHEEAKSLGQSTNYAVVGRPSSSIFEQAWYMRGFGQFLMDLVVDKRFAHALLRKLTDIKKQRIGRFLEEVGEYIDVIAVGDDLGTDQSLILSPDLYREMVKPYQAELFALIHSATKAKIFYHSCGNVVGLIEDLIEIGVDILNPVQVSAGDMGDTAALKRQFGDRICFWGAIDTQHVMPFGSEREVWDEVERRILDLAPGGGYVLAAVHNMIPDVSPENICAMFAAGRKLGQYPLASQAAAVLG